MRPRVFHGIHAKLVGLYLMLSMTSLTVLTAFFYHSAGRVVSSSIRSQLKILADGRSDLVSRWMEERQHDVEVLAQNTTVRRHVASLAATADASSAEQHREIAILLRLVRDQYDAYHEILVFDPDGDIVATTGDAPRPAKLDDALMLESIREGRRHLSELQTTSPSRSLALSIAVPITVDNGSVVGGLLARVNLDVINRMASATALLESGETYLVDQRGVFITHRDRARVFRDNISHVPAVQRVISGRNGVGEYLDYRGVAVLGAYRWLPRWQWGLLAEVDRAEAFEPLSEARRFLFLVASLVAATVLLGTLLIARRIVRPLRELTAAVNALASGTLQHRLAVAGGDEIAFLSESFNHMATSITHAHRQLEDRVRQATKDLAEKNDRLERANQQLCATNSKVEQQSAILMHSTKLAAMGEMAAGFAHEINNPLTTIRNLVQLSREGPNDIRPQDLEVLAEEVDRVSRLVLSFLTYAKPRKPSTAPVDLGAVAVRAVDLVRSQLPAESNKIETRIDPTTPSVQGDAEQLEQVVINLLLNAIQASSAIARVQVFVRTSFSDSPAFPACVQIGVTDHGCGIEVQDRSRIFGPFFTTKANGFGLGLAVSQRIVHDHGGEISFTSEPGMGATFVVSIPIPKEGEP